MSIHFSFAASADPAAVSFQTWRNVAERALGNASYRKVSLGLLKTKSDSDNSSMKENLSMLSLKSYIKQRMLYVKNAETWASTRRRR